MNIEPGDFRIGYAEGQGRILRVVASVEQTPDLWVCRDILTDREFIFPAAGLASFSPGAAEAATRPPQRSL